jgi:hypothetical protein
MGPVINWDGIVGQVNVDINQDDISTVCYSIPDNSEDSAYNVQYFDPNQADPNYQADSDASGGTDYSGNATGDSSHGTIDEFCETYTCRICDYTPDITTAQIIDDNWTTERCSRMHINGVGWVVCTCCAPTRTFHSACVGDADDSSDSEYICGDCQHPASSPEY